MCQFDDSLELGLIGGSIRYVSYFGVRHACATGARKRWQADPIRRPARGALGATGECPRKGSKMEL